MKLQKWKWFLKVEKGSFPMVYGVIQTQGRYTLQHGYAERQKLIVGCKRVVCSFWRLAAAPSPAGGALGIHLCGLCQELWIWHQAILANSWIFDWCGILFFIYEIIIKNYIFKINTGTYIELYSICQAEGSFFLYFFYSGLVQPLAEADTT